MISGAASQRAQAELDNYIANQAQVVAPEPLTIVEISFDQAPLGRGVGCRVWGVVREIAPTTVGIQAPSLTTIALGGVQAPSNAVPYTLHPTPYTLLLDLKKRIFGGSTNENDCTILYPRQ